MAAAVTSRKRSVSPVSRYSSFRWKTVIRVFICERLGSPVHVAHSGGRARRPPAVDDDGLHAGGPTDAGTAGASTSTRGRYPSVEVATSIMNPTPVRPPSHIVPSLV